MGLPQFDELPFNARPDLSPFHPTSHSLDQQVIGLATSRKTQTFQGMNPWHVIQELYDSEINSGMESDWDGGITAWIAGGRARLIQQTFERQEFGEIAGWLDYEARRLFPESVYAQRDRDVPRSFRASSPTH